MKAIGKFLKRLILFLFSCFLFVPVACSSIRQWTPTYVPEVIQDLSGDAYHTWGGFTTLGIVDMDNKIIEAKYIALKTSIGALTHLTESTADNVLKILAGVFAGGLPFSFLLGRKTLGKDQISIHEHKQIIEQLKEKKS